ncbi:MAG: bifunctional YncE family protein/alkaline phosphatase family protein [Acidobacteriota bacterium]|nr:bifunctional YncE family protein/alkaline phosphatase family protein [Acidobacteriota bacterium]
MKRAAIFCFALLGTILLQQAVSERAPKEQVGPLKGGGFLLNSGWKIQAAGEQVHVDTFPMSTAVSTDGKFLLVLNGGYNPPTISVIDIAKKHELSRTALPDAWLGLTVAPSGNLFYVGGGSSGKVYELSLALDGSVSRTREFLVNDGQAHGAPFIGDVALSPDARVLYAADLYSDSIAQINVQAGKMTDHWKTGRRPYRILVSPDGVQLLVSSWGEGIVYQHQAASGVEIARIRVGPHPTDMVWVNKPAPAEEKGANFPSRVFVAAANTNNVYSFGVTPDAQLSKLEAINISLTPMHPLGMTPSALAINKDGSRLYIACSDANAVAVADTSGQQTRVMGFIPTGWYPTAVRSLDDGQLVIANGKGLGSYPNPKGPNPTEHTSYVHQGERQIRKDQYVASIQTGTVGFVPRPRSDQMESFTQTVRDNSPYRDELIYGPITDEGGAFFARTKNHASPIRHVIYVIKENRTYDQVLGDIEKGNGDKSLTLFGEQVTPNLHRLARDYLLYDNFYENADVSADGHNWASAAIAPDYTMKLWPSEYGHRSRVYDFEGTEPANSPPAGYLWDNALEAGLTVRDYGEWVSNLPPDQVTGERQIKSVNDPALANHADMNFRSFDLEYTDVNRAKEFIREWKEFDAAGDAPQLIILRMPNDHTQGARPGALTPLAYAADNDYGMGMIVDAVSHSKLWSSTAMFVIEDDAQNGPDHVDSHRAPVWVISPYTRRGSVDSTMYNQASVLRTMELIVGLRPMTHFDAAARPMFGGFSQQPDPAPFNAIPPKVSLTARNPANGPGAKQSARMNFSDADLADDDELNDVLWRAIKLTDPPAPVRSSFGK